MNLRVELYVAKPRRPGGLAYLESAARTTALSRLRSTSEASLAFTGWASCGTTTDHSGSTIHKSNQPFPAP